MQGWRLHTVWACSSLMRVSAMLCSFAISDYDMSKYLLKKFPGTSGSESHLGAYTSPAAGGL